MTRINTTRGAKQLPATGQFDQRFISPEIDVKKLNSMVYRRGIRVKVYDLLPCPNVKSIDGREHEISCKICNGTGFVDVNPKETLASAISFGKDLEKNPDNIGTEWEEGTCQMTFLNDINLTYFSKIELMDFAKPFYEHIQRQQGNADRLRYPATQVNAVMSQTGKQYYEGTDFELDNGMIKWLARKGPKKGTIYSANYHAKVVYRSISSLHGGRYGATDVKRPDIEIIEYNEQWRVKLDYLVVQTNQDGAVIDPQTIFPPGE